METAKTLGGVLNFVLGFAMGVLLDATKLQYLDDSTGSTTCVVSCLPPSSSLWVIFLNMMRTWSVTFTPATIAVVTGLLGVAAAALRIDAFDLLVLLPLTVAASLAYLRFARPRLGAED